MSGERQEWLPPRADPPAGPDDGTHDAATEPPPLADALGGPLGIAESVIPSAAFVAVYTAAFNGGVTSMDVESIRERIIEEDMASA